MEKKNLLGKIIVNKFYQEMKYVIKSKTCYDENFPYFKVILTHSFQVSLIYSI